MQDVLEINCLSERTFRTAEQAGPGGTGRLAGLRWLLSASVVSGQEAAGG
jgi:hypothetical protein